MVDPGSWPPSLRLWGAVGGLPQEHSNIQCGFLNEHLGDLETGPGGACVYRGKPGAGQLLREHQ